MATLTQTVTVERCSDVASNNGQSLETLALDSKERMPPLMSLVVINYFLVLCTVSVVITIPTATEYAERLGGGRLFAGLMIGALPLLSRLASKRVSVLRSKYYVGFPEVSLATCLRRSSSNACPSSTSGSFAPSAAFWDQSFTRWLA